ncbi:MAG: zinc ribbon domain-containing protein [Bacilli bacterium]|jgi:hypothetical protein
MKCPKCGQNIVSNTDFCINCGTDIKKTNYGGGFNLKVIIIIMIIFIIAGTGIVLGIMFLGTDKELEQFLKNNEETKEPNPNKILEEEPTSSFSINKYYGNYLIKDIIPTNKTPHKIKEETKEFLNWSISLLENQVKIAIYQTDWIILKNTNFYLEEIIPEELKNNINNIETVFFIKGDSSTPSIINEVCFVISNNSLFLYLHDTFFKLEKEEITYKTNNNFYKIITPPKTFENSEINSFILELENEFKRKVESNTSYIINYYYKEITDNEFSFLIFTKLIGYPYGHTYLYYKTICYDLNKKNIYTLFDYLKFKNLNINFIKEEYEKGLSNLSLDLENYPFNDSLPYYVINNNLHILLEEDTIIINF